MTTKIKIIIGVGAAVLGGATLMYLKRPAAKIVIHSDGSADATLGSQILATSVKDKQGTAQLKTWNGWTLDVDFPMGGYSLKHNGKVMTETKSVTPTDTGDTYVELVHD